MRYLMIGLVSVFVFNQARACNACGGAASNEYLGIISSLPGHFIGLQYQYRWYESRHQPTEPRQDLGREAYHTMQLWGRSSLGKSIQVYAFLPYQYNQKQEAGETKTLSGIGDMSVLTNVTILRPDNNSRWKHFLQIGGGLKLPTGAYNDQVLGSGDELAPTMQAGSGSWDVLFNTNYTLCHGPIGVNAEAAFTLTTPNYQDYKYGNRLSTGLQAFYQLTRKAVRIQPAIGLRYESGRPDYDNYTARSIAGFTGGYTTYASAIVQSYIHKVGLRLGYYLPLAQQYADGLVKAKGRAELGVMYLF